MTSTETETGMIEVSEPDWNDLKAILALYQGGSVASAARILGVDASTVSRRLSAVEKEDDLVPRP